MRTLIFLLAISRLTTSSLLPYHGVTIGITPYSAPVQSQYHSQDNYGQYVYGYASGNSAKEEIKTADGVTRGGYSYIDANGILQSVQYVSDPVNGFRVSASNIPRDLPEVALAKAQHFQAFENIKAEHAYISAIQSQPPILSISPIPINNVVPISAARVAPVAYIPHTTHYTPVPVSNQYHAQDKLGQYTYGYAGPLSSKSETKTADGVTRGGYSYIDANGVLQSVQYVSDHNGFRVQGTNLPEAPAVTLIGPKVSTSVVGPKETNVAPSVIPLADAPTSNPGFVNPVILSDPNQPILTNPPVLTEAAPINDVILSRPADLTNPIHTVPFPGNGQIATHGNQNLLGRESPENPHQLTSGVPNSGLVAQNIGYQIPVQVNTGYQGEPIVGLNPGLQPENLGIWHQSGAQNVAGFQGEQLNIAPNLGVNPGHQQNVVPNLGLRYQAESAALNNAYQEQLNLEYRAGPNVPNQVPGGLPNVEQLNLAGYQTGPNVPNQAPGGLPNVEQLKLAGYQSGPNVHNQVPGSLPNVLINNVPNYQQTPDHAVSPISQSAINGEVINHPVPYGPFLAKLGAGQAYDGSIPNGLPGPVSPALFTPRQGVQQVQQTPVSALQGEQQAEVLPHSAPGGQLNNQPHVQAPSGYYTQNTQF